MHKNIHWYINFIQDGIQLDKVKTSVLCQRLLCKGKAEEHFMLRRQETSLEAEKKQQIFFEQLSCFEFIVSWSYQLFLV